MTRIRDRALLWAFLALFLASWAGQLVAEWHTYVSEQRDHDAEALFWSADFWWMFWQSTLENWQSEWLQLAAQVSLPAYLVYKGAAQSKDSDERLEAKIDWLIKNAGHEPKQIEKNLDAQFRSTGQAGTDRPISVLGGVVGAAALLLLGILIFHLFTT
jgi:hypothetical protein